MSFCFYPIFHMCKICILLEAWYFLKRAKDDIYWPRYSVSTKLILPLWWRHNIYLWRKNGTRRHARAKHYECVVFENCTQTARVYSHIICHNKSTHSWASKLTTHFSNLYSLIFNFHNIFNSHNIRVYILRLHTKVSSSGNCFMLLCPERCFILHHFKVSTSISLRPIILHYASNRQNIKVQLLPQIPRLTS